jgi:hypothetical protein
MNSCKTRLAGLVAAMLLAAGASSQASYILTANSLTATPASLGGTSFTFAESGGGVQSGSSPSNFNVIDVGVSSTTVAPASDTGFIMVTETFTLTGTSGTETFTLNGTLDLLSGNSGGVVTTFTGSTTVNTITGGSGYVVGFAGYAPPSPGSGGLGATTGNVSIVVSPNAVTVPEPASVAMLGLGMVGIGGVAFRRRKSR